jgi:hypothetical protein
MFHRNILIAQDNPADRYSASVARIKPFMNMPMRVGSGRRGANMADPVNPMMAKNDIALLGRFNAEKVGVRGVAYGTGRHVGRGLRYVPSAGYNAPSFST